MGLAVTACGAGVAAGDLATRAVRGVAARGAVTVAPGPKVCGNHQLLDGPASPPAGAVTVPAGRDNPTRLGTPHTVYWFAPGVHTLGAGKYTQIIPGDGSTYVGAPGAILSGEGVNYYAFGQGAQDVTVEYLTVTDFGFRGGNANEGVVNDASAKGWTIQHDTVEGNAGAGVMLGSHDTLRDNCLEDNGQYGFASYSTAGTVSDLIVTGNEIVGNATFDWTTVVSGCGCSGGAKFWQTSGAVVTDNYVHANHGPGLWVDTDNTGFDISGNYVAHNADEGIIYEISYNASISHNTLVDNGWKGGPGLGFPEPAIYISESGGDRAVPGPYSGRLDVTDNVLVDNWSGVVLWESANRYCSDGSDGVCTLADPSVYTRASCRAHLPGATPSGRPDYFAGCRWRTMNVTVSHNSFTFTPGAIGPRCTVKQDCGFVGLFSQFGTVAPYKGWVVPLDVSNRQHNVFADNSYVGPWRFDGFALGIRLTWSQWTHGVADAARSGDAFHGQDAGSTYRP